MDGIILSKYASDYLRGKNHQTNNFEIRDLATMDERGYIKIVGRTKEMVIVGGENVYPREIEEVLHMLPSIEIASVSFRFLIEKKFVMSTRAVFCLIDRLQTMNQ